ncbi:MAG: glycosyltransferase family 2 protein [Chromatiales bacterium]|nr:glycosyltransferase family 2 protein [Chromatiales bacterium]
MPIELLWLLPPWALAFVFLGRMRRCPPLPERLDERRVSVIIPARNEEARLPPLLASLRVQDHPNFEVILVDDNSSDRTAELGRAAGVTTLSLTEPEPGWIGKPHACWAGAHAASGEVLVFLDADTELEPGGLRRIVATQTRHGGLVSIQPYHRMRRAYERLSAGFSLIMMGGIRSFTLLGDRLESNGAFGPCMVARARTISAPAVIVWCARRSSTTWRWRARWPGAVCRRAISSVRASSLFACIQADCAIWPMAGPRTSHAGP